MDINYDIEIFPELNSQLKSSWQDFETESCNYCFQSYDWFENWFLNFRKNNKKFSLCVIKVSFNAKILCILPFEIEKKLNLNILQWAGGNQSDYFSPIVSQEFNLQKEEFINLWNKIIKLIPNIDLIYLKRQNEDVENIKNPFVSFLNNHFDSTIYQISLPKNWDEYTNRILKKSFLTQNLRKEKLLKKLGKLEFKIVKHKEEIEHYVSELVVQKDDRLNNKGVESALKTEHLSFYKEFENINSKLLETHVSSLILNDELIAIHWGIIYKKRFYYLLLSMKENSLSRYSPGRLLISFLIQWSISNNIYTFDFTLGDESYKKSWSNKKNSLFNYVKLNSFRGIVLFFFVKIKLILKSIYKKFFFK